MVFVNTKTEVATPLLIRKTQSFCISLTYHPKQPSIIKPKDKEYRFQSKEKNSKYV